MPAYVYQALDRDGVTRQGEVSAASEADALKKIAESGLTPFSLQVGQKRLPWWARDISLGAAPKLREADLEVFFTNLSTMLSAGMPLIRCIDYCVGLIRGRQFKLQIAAVAVEVRNGTLLSTALREQAVQMPARILGMIALGEASNNLAELTLRISEMLRLELALRDELRQALVYPVLLIAMSVVVQAVLVFYLTPTLLPVFSSAGSEPPTVFVIMNTIRLIVLEHGLLLIIAAVGLVGVFISLKPFLLKGMQRLAIRLPVSGPYLRKRETMRFCQSLSLMLNSGAGLLAAVRTATETVTLRPWKTLLADVERQILSGGRMSDVLEKSLLVDATAAAIISASEESDTLPKTLPTIVGTLQLETTRALNRTVQLLTPILTLVLGLIVGAIILSTISAIMDLNDAVL